jgi:hypothetical protein
MGADSKKASVPPLPAPTETDSTTPTELATEVSRLADEKSSYSLPDDGTPVTIKTRGHKASRSQTSLLIEYFEGGKPGPSGSGGDRKPSVRVRLTPSKNRDNGHIQVTETKSARKASLSRRSQSETPTLRRLEVDGDGEDAKSMSSYASATEESNVSRNPIEVEIDRTGHRRRRPASPLIPTAESKVSYLPGTGSDISAIPTDSFFDGSGPKSEGKGSKASGVGDMLAGATAGLAAAAVADKVRTKIKSEDKEKIGISKTREKEKSDRKHKSSKSRSSSMSEKDGVKSPRRRSSRTHQESVISAADSSVLTSASPSHRSYDAQSVRSGASKSSINNPKLLETVEDAIRRLILPELNALKQEHSRSQRRSSVSSGTSVSREDHASERRKSSTSEKNITAKDGATKIKEGRRREARHDLEESPSQSIDHMSVEESVHSTEATPKRSSDKLKGAAVAGMGAAALAAAALHEKSPTTAREQRRRRRAEAKSRGSEKYAEDQNDSGYLHPGPPMPLMSEFNASELTRTSILSADTDRPHSASEELTPVQEVSRGVASVESSSPTPTKPSSTLQALGARHANISHGDLRDLPRGVEYADDEVEVDEYGRPLRMAHPDEYDEDEYEEMMHGDQLAGMHYPQPGFDIYGNQVVPAPLKYVPYQPERRGLSPIPSVSGYTEGGSEIQANRDSRVTTTTTSSPEKSPYPERGVHSPNSVPSNVASREFDHDDRSLRSSGLDYRNSEVDHVTSGQAVRGIGANPNIIHSPVGVESAVASLVDGSMLEDSVLTADSGHGARDHLGHRDSMDTLEEERSHGQASVSKHSLGSHRSRAENEALARASPATTRTNASEFADEYDIDQYGRKVAKPRYRHSPTASEAAITAGAVGLAIKAARDRSKQPTVEAAQEEDWVPEGVQRNKSFKERTLEGHRPANTPSHSVDRLDDYGTPKLGASGIPDLNDPIPEIGFGYDNDDLTTNPSVVNLRQVASHEAAKDQWQGSQADSIQESHHRSPAARHAPDLSLAETAGAAAIATAAALASAHSRQASQDKEDDWHRTSDDRKRDTLITNPFEGTSPVVNIPALKENLIKSGVPGVVAFHDDFDTVPSPLGYKGDEGYVSQGPIKSGDEKGIGFSGQAEEDPFYTPKHARHLSGMSQGMASPLYDSATGMGIDRIENKDIVALMQHVSNTCDKITDTLEANLHAAYGARRAA